MSYKLEKYVWQYRYTIVISLDNINMINTLAHQCVLCSHFVVVLVTTVNRRTTVVPVI